MHPSSQMEHGNLLRISEFILITIKLYSRHTEDLESFDRAMISKILSDEQRDG